MHDTLLSKRLALPIFASDPLSSVAYATEAALVVLIGASAAGGHYVLPVSIAIAAVMAVVVLSYIQTVQAYQTESHYLHVYVSQLRRKIEPDPARPRYLLTETGVGYRFVAAKS